MTNEEQLQKAIEFAGLYRMAFPQEVLRQWYTTIVERTLPTNATHAELAANNALRDFVVKIIRQVELSNTGKVNPTCSHDVIFTPPPPMEAPGVKAKRQAKRQARASKPQP